MTSRGRLAGITGLALLGWSLFALPASAQDGPWAPGAEPFPGFFMGHKGRGIPAAGTLGYGPPGVHPGFQGFGLGYHPGYGYGGDALGVGAEGGYPFYGGPGYPHPAPAFRRFHPIIPFAYYGGPGHPTPEHPNFFGEVGPLVPDRPAITIDNPVVESAYGPFTGAVPDPETRFAPFTTRAGAGTMSMKRTPVEPTDDARPAPLPAPRSAGAFPAVRSAAGRDSR